MEGQYPYGHREKYPGMHPEDVAIWERFIDAYPKFFSSCDYNMRVGEGITPPHPENEYEVKAAEALTKKRIDVVGYQGGIPYIVEVKPKASNQMFGQLVMYYNLWIRDFPDLPRPRQMGVAEVLNPDDEYVFKLHGIPVYIV